MLDKIFLQFLNMSFTASFVIVFVLFARLLLKKVPKIFPYALWSVVLFRLICPFSFESMFSLLPTKAQPISQDIVYMQIPQIDTGITYLNNAVNSILPAATPQASVNPLQIWIFIGSVLWIVGIAILLIYSFTTLVFLAKKLKTSILFRDNIFISPNIATPFVIGIFSPKIYIPANLSNTEREYILLHEQTHIKRLDHIIKLLSFFMLCLHWFNPLVWVGFFVSGKDMEMSCDETVIKKLGNEVKKDYSSSLLTLATSKRIVGGTPLAFGEGDTKGRIKNVLNYKKPSFWIIFMTVVVCTIMAVCFLTNPINDSVLNPYVQEYTPGQGNIKGNVDVAAFEKISQDFAIGANQYGYAVFKDPKIAFATFQKLYADGIAFIQKENDLPSFSHKNYGVYKTYGWQMTDGTEEQVSQAFFVTRFLDIYENSFTKETTNQGYVEPTIETKVLSLNDVIILSQKGEALTWSDFDGFFYKETGFGLYIRVYEINELFSLWIGGGKTDSEPIYISLHTNTEPSDSIDIRTENVTDFINRHRDDLGLVEAIYSFAKLGKNGDVLIFSSKLDQKLAKKNYFRRLGEICCVGGFGY